MKLFYAPASPYSRKVRALAIEAGLAEAIELVPALPLDAADPLHLINPLGRVPTLVCEDTFWLVDSPVICEYLDSLNSSGLYPPVGKSRWRALRLQALGDGIMDSAVSWVQELRRVESERAQEWLDRRELQVKTTLAYLESDLSQLEDWSIGTLALACAWEYLNFRLTETSWIDNFPGISRWADKLADRPCLAKTRPV